MDKKKALSMLGLARRAGKLSMGHDMALKSLLGKKACVLIFASDASERLQHEFKVAMEKHGVDTRIITPDISIAEIHFSCGYKAGVITVDDENFSKKIISLLD